MFFVIPVKQTVSVEIWTRRGLYGEIREQLLGFIVSVHIMYYIYTLQVSLSIVPPGLICNMSPNTR